MILSCLSSWLVERTICKVKELFWYKILLYFLKYYFSKEHFTSVIEMLFYFNCIVSVIGSKKKWKRWMQFYSFCERIAEVLPQCGRRALLAVGVFLSRRCEPPRERQTFVCRRSHFDTGTQTRVCRSPLEAWKIIPNSLASTTLGFMSSFYHEAVLGWILWTKCKFAEADGVPSWQRGKRPWWGSVSVLPFGPPSSGQAAVIHGPCRYEHASSASAPWHSEPDTPSRKSDSDLG